MKYISLKIFCKYGSLSAFLVVVLFSIAAKAEEVEVIELNPFEVKADEFDGYYADYSLAGSRLRTSIRNIAQSVTIITQDQLEDTGVVDVNDLLNYEASTEGSGNYTRIEINAAGAPADGIRAQRETANRIRGLPAPDRARDYFPSISALGMDSYNTRMVTISRGPNSILFGLGAPSGIINFTVNSAELDKTFGSSSFRYGEFGHYRATFDWNQPVIKDRFAIRFATVYHEGQSRQKPSTDRRKRFFGALRFKITPSTVLQGYYERIDEVEVSPNSITPIDLITPWRAAGAQSWNPVDQSGNKPDPASGLQPEELMSRPVWMHAPFTHEPVLWIQRHDGNPALANGATIMASPLSRERFLPGFVSPGVTDPTLYDIYGLNLQALNSRNKSADVFNLVLRHSFTTNLHLEIGAHHEDMGLERTNYLTDRLFALAVDPNTHLINGEPNPFYGHAYMDTASWHIHFPEKSTTLRSTLAYKLDLTDRKVWMGEHSFSILLQRREMESGVFRFREAMTNVNETFVRQDNLLDGPSIASLIHRRYYLGGPGGDVSSYALVRQFGGMSYPLTHVDIFSDPFGPPQFVETEINLEAFKYRASTRAQQELDSIAIAWQGSFINERIVSTIGWRTDANSSRNTANLPVDSETGLPDYSFLDVFSDDLKERENTITMGGVAFPYPWIGFHYNYSENFQPSSRQLTLFGDELPSPQGVGRDFGFSLALLEEKLVMRLNWFKTRVDHARNNDAGSLWARVARFDDMWLPRWATSMGIAEDVQREFLKIPDGFPGEITDRGAITNLVAKGFEWELNYQPNRSFRLKFNLARQQTIESDVAPFVQDYIHLRRPFYEALSFVDEAGQAHHFWSTPNAGSVGTGVTPEQWWNTYVDPLHQQLLLTEGKVQPQQREWRANLLANYSLVDGPMRGLSFGGALRWESKGSIGFRGDLNPDGSLTLRDDPIFDKGRTNLDLWTSYSRRIMNDRVGMRIQLNVQNVFEKKQLRPIRANPDGVTSTYRILHGRTWFVTTTFSF